MPEFPGALDVRQIWSIHSTRNGVPPEPEPEVDRSTENSGTVAERGDAPDEADRPDERDAPPPEAALEAAPKRRARAR